MLKGFFGMPIEILPINKTNGVFIFGLLDHARSHKKITPPGPFGRSDGELVRPYSCIFITEESTCAGLIFFNVMVLTRKFCNRERERAEKRLS